MGKQAPTITARFEGLQVDRLFGGEPLLDLSDARFEQAKILAGQLHGGDWFCCECADQQYRNQAVTVTGQ